MNTKKCVTLGLIGLAAYLAYRAFAKPSTRLKGLSGPHGGGGHRPGPRPGPGRFPRYGGGPFWGGWGPRYYGPDYIVEQPLVIGTDVGAPDPQAQLMQQCVEIGGTWTVDAGGGSCSKES